MVLSSHFCREESARASAVHISLCRPLWNSSSACFFSQQNFSNERVDIPDFGRRINCLVENPAASSSLGKIQLDARYPRRLMASSSGCTHTHTDPTPINEHYTHIMPVRRRRTHDVVVARNSDINTHTHILSPLSHSSKVIITGLIMGSQAA